MNDLNVLSVLLSGDKYGLEILSEVNKTGAQLFLGSLYNLLRRLEKNGFVESYWGDETIERGGNRRRYYKITSKGETVVFTSRKSLLILWSTIKT